MSEDDLRTDVNMVRGAEAVSCVANSGCGGERGVFVVVVDGGSRFELLCGDPAGKVCLPSISWAKPLTLLGDVCICNNGILEVSTSRSTASSTTVATTPPPQFLANRSVSTNGSLHPTFARNCPR